MTSVSIERRLSITSAEQKVPWVVSATLVEGVELMQISTRDRGFQRFVSGSTTGMANSSWLTELKAIRQEKTYALAQDVGSSLFGGNSRAVQLEQRKQCLRMKQVGTLPKLVSIDFPDIEYDGRLVKGMKAHVHSSIDAKAPILIEVSAELLEYIKIAMLVADRDDVHRRKKARQVYWRKERKSLLARKHRPDTKRWKYKTFKPDDDSNVSMRACEQMAERWAAGDGSDSSDDSKSEEGDNDS